MTRVERFQLDFPEDFPAGELGAVYEHVGDTGDRTQTVEWGEWAGACNGIAYRFLALDEHAISLSESLDEAVAPPMPERCRQERLLFSFFSEGLSCLECSYYGFYFVGAMVDEGSFNPMADRRAITPSFVTKRYEARFHNEPLTQSMLDIDQCAEAKEWREIRNVLSHRAAPGRGFYEGGPRSGSADWMDGVLSGDAIRERRAWVGGAVTSLLVPTVDFVRRQLP